MIDAPQSSPGPFRLPACALALVVLLASPLAAQRGFELAEEVRLHSEPDGAAVAALPAGAPVAPGPPSRGEWREVTVEGWIFSQSVERTRRGGYDLVVTARPGENLRREPNGDVVGWLLTGALLKQLETRGGWTRVRRTGWMHEGTVVRSSVGGQSGAGDGRTGGVRPSAVRRDSAAERAVGRASVPAPSPADSPALGGHGGPQLAPQPTAASAADRVEAARETGLFAAPDGTPLGTLQGGAPGRVLSRAGGWARVQLEGWVREADLQPASDAALSGVTAAEVRKAPERYVGQTVDWRLQLIAVQSADELRSEMAPGQPYLLTRGPLPEPGFVYVIVTPQQADSFRALPPLQELVLRGRIRAARSKFLETPVLELVSVVPGTQAP